MIRMVFIIIRMNIIIFNMIISGEFFWNLILERNDCGKWVRIFMVIRREILFLILWFVICLFNYIVNIEFVISIVID